MPVEAVVFPRRPEPIEVCPQCEGKPFRSLMRGMVVSTWRRLLKRPYWAVICSACTKIVGYEEAMTEREQAIQTAVEKLKGFFTLSIDDFDRIIQGVGLDPEDDALVATLVELGWAFSPLEDIYIAPDVPTGRYAIILADQFEGLSDPMPEDVYEA